MISRESWYRGDWNFYYDPPTNDVQNAYFPGDLVTGSDGNLYRCHSTVSSGYTHTSYEPGVGSYWTDRWERMTNISASDAFLKPADLQGYNETWIPATQWLPDPVGTVVGASGPAIYRPNTSSISRSAIPALGFTNPATQLCAAATVLVLPRRWNGGNVYFQVYYAHTGNSTTTGDVDWLLYYQEMDEFEETFYYTLRDTKRVIDTVGANQERHFLASPISTVYIPGSRTTENHLINMTLTRTSTNDTLNADVQFFGMKFFWYANAYNDDNYTDL